MKRIAKCAALGALAGLAYVSQTRAAELGFSTGVNYASGGYGQAKPTDVYVIPLNASLRYGQWTFRAAARWLDITGPADIGAIDEEAALGASASGKHKGARTGFGDSVVSAKYAFDRIGGGPAYVDLQGAVRIPTGDTGAGLGVGATDYIADAEVGGDWGARGVYLDVARRFSGQAHLARVAGWSYAAGGWTALGDKTQIGLWYATRDPSVVGGDRPRKIGAYVARSLRAGWRAEVSLRDGLGSAASGVGAAFTLSYHPGSRHAQSELDPFQQ